MASDPFFIRLNSDDKILTTVRQVDNVIYIEDLLNTGTEEYPNFEHLSTSTTFIASALYDINMSGDGSTLFIPAEDKGYASEHLASSIYVFTRVNMKIGWRLVDEITLATDRSDTTTARWESWMGVASSNTDGTELIMPIYERAPEQIEDYFSYISVKTGKRVSLDVSTLTLNNPFLAWYGDLSFGIGLGDALADYLDTPIDIDLAPYNGAFGTTIVTTRSDLAVGDMIAVDNIVAPLIGITDIGLGRYELDISGHNITHRPSSAYLIGKNNLTLLAATTDTIKVSKSNVPITTESTITLDGTTNVQPTAVTSDADYIDFGTLQLAELPSIVSPDQPTNDGNPNEFREFDVSKDGLTLCVGDTKVAGAGGYYGSVYTFKRASFSSKWIHSDTIVGSRTTEDRFGQGTAINGDGTILAVGQYKPSNGLPNDVYIYNRNVAGDGWDLFQTISNVGFNTPYAMRMREDGLELIIADPYNNTQSANVHGALFILTRTTVNDNFTVDTTFYPDNINDQTYFTQTFDVSEDFLTIACSNQGDTVAGYSAAGSIYIYTRATISDPWVKTNYIPNPDPINVYYYGLGVSLFSNGALIAIPNYMANGNNLAPAPVYELPTTTLLGPIVDHVPMKAMTRIKAVADVNDATKYELYRMDTIVTGGNDYYVVVLLNAVAKEKLVVTIPTQSVAPSSASMEGTTTLAAKLGYTLDQNEDGVIHVLFDEVTATGTKIVRKITNTMVGSEILTPLSTDLYVDN